MTLAIDGAQPVEGFFVAANDVLRADHDGFLYFTGRRKQIIVHDGSNISPQEIEDVLLEHPSVDSVGVVGIHDEVHGENVRAYITLREGCERPPDVELIRFARAKIGYKAPERVTGSGKATIKSDLFALGVMLWEMLRGERCFVAGNELETMDQIVRFDISHASRRVSGLSSKLSEVLRRNLDRDPERRYPDAYKVLQRLSQSPEAGAAEKSRQELARLVTEAMRTRRSVRP